MLKNPSQKYRAFECPQLKHRTWPNSVIAAPPIWLSTDLRDGNQALIEPMNIKLKRRMFDMLVKIGFKEIEVAFPSASQTEFDFVRQLIEEDLIPDNVTIQVLTQAREEMIGRTFESLRGAKRAIVHLYNATSPTFRRVVFNTDRKGIVGIAVRGIQLMKLLASEQPETEWRFEYSPETFTGTELEFAKEICDAVSEVVGPTPDKKLIINLPATVELATPNVFADQIEWMHQNLSYRENIVLSVHPHNDRGTGIAAAELAQMAGADRVEGCLFGNGERTGNVCLVTLAMNLYTQGIHPGLDFSNLDEVRRCAEYCTKVPVHPRHPYAGDLVHTAFSGSHQDAIKKGFAVQQHDTIWEVPYLPIDPSDVGRSYDTVIRVNSQSGKGGIAYLLEREYGLRLPRRMQIELSRMVQTMTEATGQEAGAENLHALLRKEYLDINSPYRYIAHHLTEDDAKTPTVGITVDFESGGCRHSVCGTGNGPIDAFINAFGGNLKVKDYYEHAIEAGAAAKAVAYVELGTGEGESLFGIGVDANIVTASVKAIFCGINRFAARNQSSIQVIFQANNYVVG